MPAALPRVLERTDVTAVGTCSLGRSRLPTAGAVEALLSKAGVLLSECIILF